ncbi:DUF4097 family beta strand repeat-containing protein [Staphylococcus pseudintermedius]|uniref:DUF4097 family beta strand repeat-containing protein n=1 Tax=Staphylococcus pseudintermedius TaxID=283734 RepID=UPI001123CAAA|nr:DUF4097 family beta strand repeat-containing protein [Staphylococcus pseudintermedius]EGQ1742235.1 hypothetical protein [Staphylococcus pseudintermedius]EGQ3731472.1 DUF4097 domain-containing protein [Staphylococcus pseudintermedius]EGQ4202298.1 DUF4097 domain-containing protein [Staphylococcus pseudintermedius]EGQ4328969.1 hypothetical protein [Staphylococcus pseudintermedius]EHS7172114.1 DUF4097 family beta strand repeat protein [Staphylococcus pseudintermedius]
MKRALFIVFLIGCVMFVVGLAGTVYYTFFHDQRDHEITQKTYKTDDIKKLTLEIKGRDVTFVKGDTLKIKGDILNEDHLKVKKNGTQMNVSISSERRQPISIHLNPLRPLDRKQLIITLPSSQMDQVALNGTDTTMTVDAFELAHLTLNLTRADLYIDDSHIQQLATAMKDSALYTEHTDFKKMTAKVDASDVTLEDVSLDIPMSWEINNGIVDVTYKGQLSNTAFHIDGDEGAVDLDGVEGLNNNQVGRGEHQVDIKVTNYGDATFSAYE